MWGCIIWVDVVGIGFLLVSQGYVCGAFSVSGFILKVNGVILGLCLFFNGLG